MTTHPKLRGWPMWRPMCWPMRRLTCWPTSWLTGLACAAAALAAQAQVPGPAVGTGTGTGTGISTDQSKTAPNPARAMVQHHETLRKCWRLDVAAVRDECQRQAQRTLDQQTVQWQRQRSYPWQGDGAAQPAITLATGASRSR